MCVCVCVCVCVVIYLYIYTNYCQQHNICQDLLSFIKVYIYVAFLTIYGYMSSCIFFYLLSSISESQTNTETICMNANINCKTNLFFPELFPGLGQNQTYRRRLSWCLVKRPLNRSPATPKLWRL